MEPTQTEMTVIVTINHQFKISEIRQPNAVIVEMGNSIFLTFFVDDPGVMKHISISDPITLKMEIKKCPPSPNTNPTPSLSSS